MKKSISISLLMVFIAFDVVAAPPIPDAGILLESQKQREQPPQLPLYFPEIETKQSIEKKADTRQITKFDKFLVKGFKLVGELTVFTETELLSLIESAVGQSITLDELRIIVSKISTHYHHQGYFLTKAYLPPQDITEGIISIAVREGTMDADKQNIDIKEKALRVNKEFIKNMLVNKVPLGEPLYKPNLEKAILMINDLPGLTASATLNPGAEAGSSRVSLDIKESKAVQGEVHIDNFGNYYTGDKQLRLQLYSSNLTGYGDLVSLRANVSNSDNSYLSLGYKSYVGSSGLSLGINYSNLSYRLGKELKLLNSKGGADDITLSLSYPLQRSRRQSFYFNANYDIKNYLNEANGVVTGDKEIDVLNVSVHGDRTDSYYGGGRNQALLELSAGELDLSATPLALLLDQLPSGSQRHGKYSKLSYSFSRLQHISDKAMLSVKVNGQFANDNLDSSEQLQMGGAYGVRAYPTGEASVDEGYKFTLETYYSLYRDTKWGSVQALFFYDHAELTQFHKVRDQVLITPNKFTLAGWGLGLQISDNKQFNINLLWAKKIGENPLRNPITGLDTDGQNDNSRFWLNASYLF